MNRVAERAKQTSSLPVYIYPSFRMSESKSSTPHRKSIEIRSYHDDKHYNILVSAHHDVIFSLALPFSENLTHVIKESLDGYMPVKIYDKEGSNVRCFANGYIRITHKVKFSSCDEVTPILRENISDIMFHEGWDLAGFTAHQGPSQNSFSTTVVEKWVKVSKT